jgi:Hypothetical protein (DUF2513)
MQVELRHGELEMKRNMDLVRNLLLGIEADPRFDGTQYPHLREEDVRGISGISGDNSNEEIYYHLMMLIEEGYIKGSGMMEGFPVVNKLTWKGHELIDDIRDQDIWAKTKERASGLTSVGISFIWEIAKAEIRKKLNLP